MLREATPRCQQQRLAATSRASSSSLPFSLVPRAAGHDLLSLLHGFLQEALYCFAGPAELVFRDMRVLEMRAPEPPSSAAAAGDDQRRFYIRACGYGERFARGTHPPGVEVKAATYSNMQIHAPWGVVTSNDGCHGAGPVVGGGGCGAGGASAPSQLPPPSVGEHEDSSAAAAGSCRLYRLYFIVDI